jgi:hypothetical protein
MLRKALADGVESGESSSEDTVKPRPEDAAQRFEHYELPNRLVVLGRFLGGTSGTPPLAFSLHPSSILESRLDPQRAVGRSGRAFCEIT